MVYPWHRSGSLNNQISKTKNYSTNSEDEFDYRSALLKRKVMSSLRYSFNSVYLGLRGISLISDGLLENFNS